MRCTDSFRMLLCLASLLPACTPKNPDPSALKPGAEKQAVEERDPFPPTRTGRQMPELTASEFVFQLHRLHSGEPANFVYSPLSLKLAFELLHPGSTGEIRKTLESNFGLGGKSSLFQSESASAPQVKIANGIWMKAPASALPAYRTAVKELGSEIRPLGLAAVNDFVKAATEGKITKVLDSLGSGTELVAVNALYFKGDWVSPFKKESTAPGRFQSSPYATMVAGMMKQTGEFEYGEDETSQWIDLPYAGGPMAMTLLLPKKRFELAALEKDLSSSSLKARLAKSTKSRVEIVLPKFKFSQTGSMKELLVAAGYQNLFSSNEWKKISQSPPKLSDVIQAIAIEVNEKGTEAAAATAAVMTESALMNPLAKTPKKFICDQPFAFLLRNTKSGEIHFMGKVYAPDPVK